MRLVLAFLISLPAWGAEGLVGTCKTASGATTATTAAIDTTGASLLVTMVATFNTAVCSGAMTDNKGNAWHCVGAYTVSASTQGALWYAWDHGGTALSVGAGHTVAFSQSSSFVGIVFRAFSGTLTLSDPLRTQNGNSQTVGTTVTTNSITPISGDLILSGVADAGSSGYTVNSPLTTDCTIAYSAGNNMGAGLGYQLGSGGTAMNQTWSTVIASSVATIAAFKKGGCTVTTTTLPNATLGTAYSQTIATNGCTSPTFAVTTGSLQARLILGSSSGIISGTPCGFTGANSFSVTATDAGGASYPQALSITNPLPLVFAGYCKVWGAIQ